MPPKLRTYLEPYVPPSTHWEISPSSPGPSSSPTASPPPHEEELYLSPDHLRVIWRPLGGPSVYKQWRQPSPVLQALWAYFSLDGGRARCMCVLRDPELLVVYPPDGDIYEVPLPCQAQAIFALGKDGLLIQRQAAEWEAEGLHGEGRGEEEEGEARVVREEGEEGLGRTRMVLGKERTRGWREKAREEESRATTLLPPVEAAPALFSLRHPLEEVRPVAMALGRGAGATEGGMEGEGGVFGGGAREPAPVLLCDVQEGVIFTEEIEVPSPQVAAAKTRRGEREKGRKGGGTATLVVTYNGGSGQHSVWAACLAATEEEEEEREGEGEEGGREGECGLERSRAGTEEASPVSMVESGYSLRADGQEGERPGRGRRLRRRSRAGGGRRSLGLEESGPRAQEAWRRQSR